VHHVLTKMCQPAFAEPSVAAVLFEASDVVNRVVEAVVSRRVMGQLS
jgi:hypothetical protein